MLNYIRPTQLVKQIQTRDTSDILILLRTIKTVLKPEGAY